MADATYDVVLLIEQPLSRQDAKQVLGLHDEIEEHVRYHVLLPVEDAAARIESAMGSLAASDALASKVAAVDAREAIILTRPHVVSEFFHLDWTSRARRKIGVPVLHLLERENFDEQAGGGEGVSGV